MAALVALAAPTGATEPTTATAPQPVQAIEESVDVRVVNLEAVVTDEHGRRVSGLSADDFRLRVDGVETPIGYFAEIDERVSRSKGEVEAGAGGAPGSEPSWQSRNVLVFVDELTTLGARRDFVLRALSQQLDALASGDQVAVVAFTGSRLEVLCGWTSDRERLASVLAAIERRPARGILRTASRRQAGSDLAFLGAARTAAALQPALEDTGPSASAGAGEPDSRSPRPGESEDLEDFNLKPYLRPVSVLPPLLFDPLDKLFEVAEAAASAMRGLPAPPGRKMMLLLTEGFSSRATARPMIAEAGRLGYSIYPVDVMGLDTLWSQNDVEFDAPHEFQLVSTAFDRSIDYALHSIAAATGGKAALNSNRLVALERLVEDSASYYLLGFSPTWHGDDRSHRVELTVGRRGLHVRTRRSFVDSSRRTRLALDADATLLLGRARMQPRLRVTVGEPAARAGARASLPIMLGVPVEALAFVPHEQGFQAEAPVILAWVDPKGRRQEQPGWLQLDLAELPLEGTFAEFHLSLATKTRPQRVVVTVHDARSGEALWGEAGVEPVPIPHE